MKTLPTVGRERFHAIYGLLSLEPLDFYAELCYNWLCTREKYSTGENAMNIWDSVQRGLEKASHEAARIAKTQRLRATIDTLSRQIQAQQSTLIQKTMELFARGQLTQSELLSICQSLTTMQQQLAQAQYELKQIPTQGQQSGPQMQPGTTGPYPSTTSFPAGENLAPTIYAPLPPIESTTPIPVPPPPPGVDATISQQRTTLMQDDGQVAQEQTICANCHNEVLPSHAYCQNCGAPVKGEASYLPTIRGTFNELPTVEDARTTRAPETNIQEDAATIRADEREQAHRERNTSPSLQNQPTSEDGG